VRLLRYAGAFAVGIAGGAFLSRAGARRAPGSPWLAHPALVPRPLVVAHRGAAGLYPENTLYAFRRALADCRVDAFEFDVQVTADGHAVVLHDGTVDRTTDGRGDVAALTLEQVRRLDAGYRFSRDGGRTFPFRGQGIRIPTVDEALELLHGFPLIVEIKTAAAQRPLLAALARAEAQAWAVVAGEQDSFRTLVHHYRGPISGSVQQIERWYRAHMLGLGRLAHPGFDVANLPEYWEGRRIVTRRLIRGLHAHGVAVHVWTVNDPADMARLIAWGVDGIITDRPDVLRAILPVPHPASADPAPHVVVS
jgi:glycerophosphoryl diester phosphodiesterase